MAGKLSPNGAAVLSKEDQLVRYARECESASYEGGPERRWLDVVERGEALGFGPEQTRQIIDEAERSPFVLLEGPPRRRKGLRSEPVPQAAPAQAPQPAVKRRSLVKKRGTTNPANPAPTQNTLAALMKREFAPADELLQEILVRNGFFVLGGPTKIGKSILVTGLALAIAFRESEYIGRKLGRYGPVIVLALESSAPESQGLFARLLPDGKCPDNVHIFTREDLPSPDEDRMEWLRGLIASIRPVLVIVDPWVRFRPAPRGQALYDDEYAGADGMRALGLEHDCLIGAIHHTGKAARGRDPAADLIATTGLGAGASVVLGLRRNHGSKRGALVVTGNSVPYQRIALDFDGGTLRWSASDHKEGRPDDTRREAKAWLREQLKVGPILSSEIFRLAAEHQICSARLLRAAKAELGVQSKRGQGNESVWVLP